MPRLGSVWTKHPSGRVAQVTALTDTHAIMYWPDADEGRLKSHPPQTAVKLERFSRAEWEPHDPPDPDYQEKPE